jgi:hypothetical protein
MTDMASDPKLNKAQGEAAIQHIPHCTFFHIDATPQEFVLQGGEEILHAWGEAVYPGGSWRKTSGGLAVPEIMSALANGQEPDNQLGGLSNSRMYVYPEGNKVVIYIANNYARSQEKYEHLNEPLKSNHANGINILREELAKRGFSYLEKDSL